MASKNDPQYMKEYYEKNKQKYKDVYNALIRCDYCNCNVQKLNFSKHTKSKKHQQNVEYKNVNDISKDDYSLLKEEIRNLKEDITKLKSMSK